MRKNSQVLTIEGPAGLIEVRLTESQLRKSGQNEKSNSAGLVVISHPHPQFGGTMNNKVVTTIERTLQAQGYTTLAYNFRGVGQSEGEYDQGQGEQDDLRAVVHWARQSLEFEELVLAGFSFGGYVTLSAQTKLAADRLLIVAPPVGLYDFSNIAEVTVPWEVVIGLEDEVVDVKEMMDWVMSRLHSPSLYCRAGASHFMHGELVWLKKILLSQY